MTSNVTPIMYQRELKTYVHTKTFIHVFTAALFIKSKKWEQPACPLIEEWKKQIWSIYTTDSIQP